MSGPPACGQRFDRMTCEQAGAHICRPRAAHAEAFFRQVLVRTQGDHVRRRFILPQWQARIVAELAGTVTWDAARERYARRYRECYMSAGEGSGLRELTAGLLLWLLVGTGAPAGALIGCLEHGEDLPQTWLTAAQMARLSPVLRSRLAVSNRRRRITDRKTGSALIAAGEPIPAGLAGGHAPPARAEAARSALAMAPDALLLTGGSASADAGWERDRAEQVLASPDLDTARLIVIHAASPGADWSSPDTWRAAMPSLGVFPPLAEVAAEHAAAARSRPREQQFRRARLNQLPPRREPARLMSPRKPDLWWGAGDPPPELAVWPRLMTAAHPDAAGSYGPSAIAWAEARRLHNRAATASRWWQRLAMARALEHDKNGRLLWRRVIISAPRQSGKSWLERMACAWRIHQAARFGEQQALLHTAHKLIAAQEVWRPAARWATGQGLTVRWTNGEQQIELDNGSRWMIQAAGDGTGVAFSLTMALIDEAWRVPRQVLDEAIDPTMAESESPQIWLVSTAGTSQSDLMLTNRAAAIATLDDPADTLLIEWSAPPDPDLDIDDPAVWQACQAHWDARRAERMASARAKITERAWRQQWLNQWVPGLSGPLLGEPAWLRASTVSAPRGALAFGAQVAGDRTSAVIVACGGGTAELIEQRDGAGWVAARLAELAERHEAVAVGVPGTGPAASVADELRDMLAENVLCKMNAVQMSAACGQVYDRLSADPPELRLRAHATLASAVATAERRPGGAGWAWSLDQAGMVMGAVSAALWASDHAVAEEPLVVV